MNVIIIEDEQASARRLKRMLEKLDVTVHEMLTNVKESVTWFQNNPHPDLIFLDIQLSDGLSFDIFDAVDVKSAIIFTTAFDEYALQAFKLNSIDYLLKPIDEEELFDAVKKYNSFKPQKTPVPFDFNEIKKLLANPIDRGYKKRYTTQIGSHIKMISVDEIECFYAENKGVYGHTTGGRDFLFDTTLEQLENELSPENFFRVNRSFYINIHAIKDIITYSNSRLKLVLNSYSGSDIIVAREKVKDFKLWLE